LNLEVARRRIGRGTSAFQAHGLDAHRSGGRRLENTKTGEPTLMRRRILTLLLAALVLAVVVPLGAALTLDRRQPHAGHTFTRHAARTAVASAHADYVLPDAASLALTGSVLIGLAAAVRRAG
jgi:hypothetical protein